ncbi:Bardet-Biedl syndrome 2 protein-like protein [Aphelenchoides bicaudatus]|nr:Bardet-Biedl syndrome 2 protein-like protein [Aphelenchoides bicaudatus]
MKGSLKEILNYSFNHRIAKNAACSGHFDETEREHSIFHVNEPIGALSVFPANEEGMHDLVVVGTEKSLLMFDVYNNKTVFHKEMPEGINVIQIGHLDEHPDRLIVCGCGTTIWGINAKGEDIYWTTLGDEVRALAICDIDGDEKNELIVGTSGTEIKILKNASLLKELNEGDPTTVLCTIQQGSFAFGLVNGVIGIYRRWERLWRVKTKNQICALLVFPHMDNGGLALSCVWHNGKIDVRNVENGENYRKMQLDGDVVSVFKADVLQTGSPQLILVYSNGKIRGVTLNPDEDEEDNDLTQLHEFGQKKHMLMEELRPMIPPDTQMECTLELAIDRGLLLHIKVSNNIPIKAVLMFAEGIFPSECYAIHPNIETPALTTMIRPLKNTATEILIRVNHLQVLEFDRPLPRFSTQVYYPDGRGNPEGFVEVEIGMKKDLVNRWLIRNFLISEDDVRQIASEGKWSAMFCCCYSKEFLLMEISENGQFLVKHNDIGIAGEVLQSLVTYLDIKQYTFRAKFPKYQMELNELINSMEDLYTATDKLATEWTERLNVIRETVVRAEDCIATQQIPKSRRMYVRLALLNRESATQRLILGNSKEQLVNALKSLNQMIKLNAQLRVGEDANELVRECRRLVATENFQALARRLLFSS